MSGGIPDRFVRFAVNFQTWRHLTFLRWSYQPAMVQALVPEGLTVQQWDGLTWVGITPFQMTNVKGPLRVPIPGWQSFPELNVRTYVRTQDGRDGIWFLGLVVPRLSFVAAAGSLGLAYQRSAATTSSNGSDWHYRFATPHPIRLEPDDDAWFDASVTVGQPLAATERSHLVDALTGRWTAFHQRAGQLWGTPVYHEPWPLRVATATGRLTEPLRWAGLPKPTGEPLVHASYGVSTRLGLPDRVGKVRNKP